MKRDAWVRPYFHRYRRALALALALGVAAYAFAAALMFTSGYLVSASAMVETILVLHLPLIFVRIFGIGKPILQYLERLTSHDWVLRMTSDLRRRLFSAFECMTVPGQAARKTGDVLGLLAEDVGHIQNLYLRSVFPTVVAWALWAAIAAGLGFLSLPLALCMLLVLGVETLLVPLVSVLANAARQMRVKRMRNDLYADLTDNVLGVADWVFSGRGRDYRTRHRARREALRAEQARMDAFARRRDVVVQTVFALGAAVLLAWAGTRFGSQGGFAPNWIAAFVLGFFPLADAFAPLSSAAVEAVAHRDSVERLNELPAPGAEAEGPAASHGPELPRVPFDVELRDVRFRYPGSREQVLDGLTCAIPQGQKLAVLGRSGAGKSTIAMLVRGDARPDSGRVLVGGVDPAGLGDAAARYVGVVQQGTYLFNMTLLENLRIAREDATRAEVLDVLAKVGLSGLVERLPEGLDTMVDEAGLRFSGGERHRVALARILLADAPVVLLDEPMAGLDPVTERALLDTLFDALADKTVIMVTHHLAGVERMDRVLFVEDGRAALDGAPADLERESERYRALLAFDRGW